MRKGHSKRLTSIAVLIEGPASAILLAEQFESIGTGGDSAFVLECRLLNEARAEQGRRINELGPISREAQHSFLTSRSH